MRIQKRSKSQRLTVHAAAVGVAMLSSAVVIGNEAAERGAGPTPPALPEAASSFLGPICHAPTLQTNGLMRLAQTEVGPMGRQAGLSPEQFADKDPPLWDRVGAASFTVTTANGEAQKYFDQGLRLAYAFNHAEAQRAFRKAQKLDAACAMCYWGEALVLGPNINLPMGAEAVAPAFAAAGKAQSLAGRITPREAALIAALAVRYANDPKADRAALDKQYADAMAKVAAQFPDDNEIAVLYAEAVMDISPWNYWEPDGRAPHPHSAAIVPTLERVLAKDPDHAGAIHYYIHAVEASDRPERAERFADRLRGATPAAGHLVHMPSHIYYRLGRYTDALAVNKDAAAADEKYLAETGAPPGVYSLGYYPHNVHFILATGQMSGDAQLVIAAAEKLSRLIPDEAARGIAMVQPVKAAPYFAHAQFSPPETVLALPKPDDGIPYVTAMWHYARAIALVRGKQLEAAAKEADAIAAIDRTADFSLLTASQIPAGNVLKVAMDVIHGRIAQAKGDYPAAIARFETAAKLQDGVGYMEPPYWYYPVRQSLGAALVQAGRYDEAEKQFELALKRAPNSAWTYYGYAELFKARGDADKRSKAEDLVNRTWTGDRALLSLSNL
jgi:tetratricopeptide (TPR) repeat protein